MAVTEAEVTANAEIDQPMIFAEFLGTAPRHASAGAVRTRKADRSTLLCRTIAELANHVHRRKGLPVKADRAFWPHLALFPNPGAPGLISPPEKFVTPPSIHQVQVSLATGAGGGALVRFGLERSAALALGVAAASATTEAPASRAIRSPLLWLL